jgi:hypothetical protein
MKVKAKNIFVILFGIILLLLIWYGINWWFRPVIPKLISGEIISIEISVTQINMISNKMVHNNYTYESGNPDVIKSFVSLFNSVKRVSDHKCRSLGCITLHGKDGSEDMISILPGHDDMYYEYRYMGQINRINRKSFIEIMDRIGVDTDILLVHP